MLSFIKSRLTILSAVFLLIVFCVFLWGKQLHAQPPLRFEHINQNNGLSQGTINAIYQDKEGLMWFATKDGLNRWDGKKMLVYRHVFSQKQSLPNNHILCLTEDNKGRLWLGSLGGGLFFQDVEKSGFHALSSVIEIPDSLSGWGQVVYCLSYDSSNDVLYAGTEKGIGIINLKNNSIDFLEPESLFDSEADFGSVLSLLADNNSLWIGTEKGGLLQYKLKSKHMKSFPILHKRRYLHENDNPAAMMDIKKDADGNIWVASFGDFIMKADTVCNCLSKLNVEIDDDVPLGINFSRSIAMVGDTAIWTTSDYGLFIIDPKKNKTSHYTQDPTNSNSLMSNSLKTVFHDHIGGIWIGENGFGINYYFPQNKPFHHIRPNENSASGLTFRSVRAIYKDDDGSLFVGGYGNLNKFDREGRRLWEKKDINIVYVLHPDPIDSKILWVGHEGGHLRKIRKSDGATLSIYPEHNFSTENNFFGWNIYAILDYSSTELFLGTEYGINIINKTTGQTQFIRHDKSDINSLPEGYIKVLYRDKTERIWVGTMGGGLAYLIDNQFHFQRFTHNPTDPNSLSSNIVNSILQAKNGIIYVGTERGLNILKNEHEGFSLRTTADGLANDVVYGLLEDTNGNIWISTNKGISCYNPTTDDFVNFDKADGLQENEFNNAAFLGCPDGTLYFGGINGITYFKPNLLKYNTIIPKVIFTQLKIGNKSYTSYPPITQANTINLDFNNQAISLEFAALNYYKSEKNQYAFRINELQKEYTSLGTNNSIEIAHLGYGDFTIEVIASNNDGVWNINPTTLHVIIPPPLWAQNWFKAGVVALFLLLTALFYRVRLRSIKQKKLQLEKIVAERTTELMKANQALVEEIRVRKKVEEDLLTSNKTKDKFFSIIAHDLKSPFNALIGLTEILDSDFEKIEYHEQKEIISTIRQSMRNFYKLLENLLTWARNQTQKIKLQPVSIQLSTLIEENCNLLSQQAKQKEISVLTHLDPSLYVWADLNTTHTIVRNLLSNAIKFTYAKGRIEIKMYSDNQQVYLAITDSGIGISPENLSKLFKLDEQFKQAGTNQEKGTGLGLILCKDFAEENGGAIKVESYPGKGSTFTLRLPAAKDF